MHYTSCSTFHRDGCIGGFCTIRYKKFNQELTNKYATEARHFHETRSNFTQNVSACLMNQNLTLCEQPEVPTEPN